MSRPPLWTGADERWWDEQERQAAKADGGENGLYACPTCGENVTRYGRRCARCERNIEEDRLNRGD